MHRTIKREYKQLLRQRKKNLLLCSIFRCRFQLGYRKVAENSHAPNHDAPRELIQHFYNKLGTPDTALESSVQRRRDP